MSGRKTTYTSIDVDELNALRRQASAAATLAQSNRAMQQLAERTDRFLQQQQNRVNELNRTIDNLNHTMEHRDAAASKERQQLREQLNTTIRNTNQALRDMSEQNQRNLESLDSQFRAELSRQRKDTVQMIEESNRQMNQNLENAVSSLESQIGTVSSRVDQIEHQVAESARQVGILFDSDAVLLDLAREYADTARALNNDTAQNFRTEILLPSRLAQAQAQLHAAEQDIRDAEGDMPTNAPIARQTARQAVEAALQLHEDMIRAEQEWQVRYQAARQAVSTAQAQAEACRQMKIPSEAATVEIDVDHWSNGDLTALRSRTDAFQSRLDNAETLTLADLEGLREAGIQAAQEMLESAQFAAVAMSASQDRADIAQDVADHMRDALGLIVQSHGFQGNDQRGGHRIHLKNPLTGFEMVVTQYPESNGESILGNRLESDILDYGTNNEREGDDIACQALTALADLGFCQGPVETVSGYENRPSQRREQADMEAWQREQASVPTPTHKPQPQTAAR